MPADPLDSEALQRKFMRLTAGLGEARSAALFERLVTMESLPAFTLF